MAKVVVTKPFKYAYGGVRVVAFAEGAEIDGDDEAAAHALAEGLGADPEAPPAKAENGKKPGRAAPEAKPEAPPETKA